MAANWNPNSKRESPMGGVRLAPIPQDVMQAGKAYDRKLGIPGPHRSLKVTVEEVPGGDDIFQAWWTRGGNDPHELHGGVDRSWTMAVMKLLRHIQARL